jgi:hypothetical protein
MSRGHKAIRVMAMSPPDGSYPPDVDDVLDLREYEFETIGCRASYNPKGKVTHIVYGFGVSYCGRDEGEWWGRGSQEEYEVAHTLPLCKACANKTRPAMLRRVDA